MRIVHLPVNIASQIQIMVRALRAKGASARGLLSGPSIIHSGEGMESCYYGDHKMWTWPWARDVSKGIARSVEAIFWADVLHYHYGGIRILPHDWDVRLALGLKRLLLINFWGTDIRVGAIEMQDNPYFKRVYPTVPKWIEVATPERSHSVQTFYASRGFHCVLGSESMLAHVDRNLFPDIHMVRGAIDLQSFTPRYPDPERKRPLVVHSPSDPLVKGTQFVQTAVERLQRKGLEFDFRLLTGIPRRQLLAETANADLVLDQFVLGCYGMVAIEAMALGKPVFCYIKPTLVTEYPAALPIINTTIDDLEEKLEFYLTNGHERRRIGMLGRTFAEEFHCADKQAAQLIELYTRLRNH